MRILSRLLVAILIIGSLPVPAFAAGDILRQTFDTPIDAISTEMHAGDEISVRYRAAETWSEWIPLELDEDRGPENQESELVMLPRHVQTVEFRGLPRSYAVHPITVSRDPVKTLFAATNSTLPLVISRESWGADASLLVQSGNPATGSQETGDTGGSTATTPTGRLSDCEMAQVNYPEEFKTDGRVVRTDAQGRTYRWSQTFSKDVKLLVVHHTALKVTGDPRSGVERVRAIYKYHADSRGWGDVGYNYLIDEEGKIYEGRAGGKSVVAGHAYCNNIGTIGVVLLGNFDLEAPTAKQTTALQTLLITLGKEYNLDLTRSTTFHGKTFTSPVVKHKDLLSTSCPGYYLSDAFGQVVRNVQANNPTGAVKYATPVKTTTPTVEPPVRIATDGRAPGLSYLGTTTISMNPGSQQRLSFVYTAPLGGAYEGKKIADVQLGHPDLSLLLTLGSLRVQVKTGILLPTDVPDGESVQLQMIIQAPKQSGTYWMSIGGLKFVLSVSGRRIRTDVDLSRFGTDSSRFVNTDPAPKVAAPIVGRIRPNTRRTLAGSTAIASPTPTQQTTRTSTVSSSTSVQPIRIRLSADALPIIQTTSAGTVQDVAFSAGRNIQLTVQGTTVRATDQGTVLAEGTILRFSPSAGAALSLNSVRGQVRSYYGVLEARVIDGVLTIINELPLETYMRGLAEEPDTEPYEKQRAFAIAARTYALWYMQPENRKFPGKPYDGSDDPAVFQVYAGAGFANSNPAWIRAVASTANQVLRYNGQLIKPPYFSSDDGRTRSPAEAGWNNFPFAEIFSSKPDPWCSGMSNRGHGVGMSGCGAEAQANAGSTGEEILRYYYPGTDVQ